MENKAIARQFRLLSQLMELYDENSFKVRSIANASFKIDKLLFRLADKPLDEIEKIDGIGKSTAAKVWELITTNHISELDQFLEQTPDGILEIMSIKGLGPKKVKVIWQDLEIENIGELYYACNENRLIEAKGFGLKTQEEIRNAIEFKMASNGRFIYAKVEATANRWLNVLKDQFPDSLVSFTGQVRRRCEIIDSLDFLIGTLQQTEAFTVGDETFSISGTDNTKFQTEVEGLKINISFCEKEHFTYYLFVQTGSEAHTPQVLEKLGDNKAFDTEEALYKAAGLQYIEPELREGLNEIELAAMNKLPELITFADLKGSLHNHSTWSDGVNTLEEMALFCRDELKLQYFGIADHSKTAVYAKGLSEIRVLAQHDEIDLLNNKLAPFKILKGIESDILYDGSLDYPVEILSTFDYVVASVHSVFKMSEDRATERLVKAIENPYTTILGHPTGRLLLSRNGYPINYKKIIDACAENGVVIEINANPLRLDLDWRWHRYAIEKGVILSINPDAHRKEGFYDMHFGVLAARKGGVSKENCLNAMSLEEISNFLDKKRSAITV
ncbi:DNA polymerase/3'-5' exonuclease PolX [Pedobacter sp. HMF7647]|uniref:DNA polymerase/3'-5' exonuclease PolX n=1 Tax=Hufsiella arboris TaxID=2695275 RepID=A0A7K1YD69_9SPHI|nr:DNA polymerase/3'-5' exonuclease PolX [Hufsiella arboris]MXV52533.1 DNA polymerase/3'-5' exonuclease PolX [Hufsiella arboris]